MAVYNTVEFIHDVAAYATKVATGFEVVFQSGKKVLASKLIFATGITDLLPDIPGFSVCWGISVVHCPYCHGYEYRGRKTAVLANGETAIHYAMLVGNLTGDLEIFTHGKAEFTAAQMEKLQKHNIVVRETEVVEIEHDNGHLKNVVTACGDKFSFDVLYHRPPFKQHCDIPQSLGCELNEQGYLKVDSVMKTTVEGIYACGDNASMMRSVANAVSAGNFAGAAVNRELSVERF